ncbi:hydroxymethylbilane synthase [Effusibacillus lacus]|uniref:Porphobilinogen deaminase n=1 Tax=Effusibacillus lacus TaxID=1348429 RepID=A0A292YP08_9BACL|nr:hydroxymethylbilane synthase [Effusibacillus lacus]TCS76474.1 hydroxymethylbilane synthase [Effusibacillus lacus]GAX90503.1 hydroxymethylbilane synthase [Effusibacillus lacus]
MRQIKVATRKSALAVTQTNWVCSQLESVYPGLKIEMEKIVTQGDRILEVTLSKIGGKGLFVKEIEQALLDGTADFAVHSMKDMPAEIPDGLMIVAVPEREDPRDVLISRDGRSFIELPKGAKVGTSSLRRAAQIKAARPDLEIRPLRGNIDTRLRKLEEEELDAIILAAAGLSRMGWLNRSTERLSVDICIPAVGQGALAVQCRSDDKDMIELLSVLDHEPTRMEVMAERAFLGKLNGGCQVPIGGFAESHDGLISLRGFVGTPDGSTLLKEFAEGNRPEELGLEVAAKLMDRGAFEILEAVNQEMKS